MRTALLPALALIAAHMPALATGSVECGTTDGSDIEIVINTDRDGAADRVRGATLTMNGRTLTSSSTPPGLRVGRATLGRTQVQVELLAPTQSRVIAALSVRVNPDDASIGTLTIESRQRPISCEFG